jgi:hypothetical protein
MAAGEHRLGVRVVGGREQDRHPGAHVLAPDQGGVPNPDPGHVGDGVARSGPAAADGDAQVAYLHGRSIPDASAADAAAWPPAPAGLARLNLTGTVRHGQPTSFLSCW